MCGLFGVINSETNIEITTLQRLAQAVSFRGPNYTGTVCYDLSFQRNDKAGPHALFHNRLSIIDLNERSNQPFEDDAHSLVFNGEIYNYKDIRASLQSENITFQTSSDTEVLFMLLKHKGTDGIKLLNGMFAFAFINKNTQEVILARDRLGIKPLHYTINNKTLLFSSELDSIVRLLPSTPDINHSSISDFLLLQYTPTPNTIYKDIYKLKPGHFIKTTLSKLNNLMPLEPEPYWSVTSQLKIKKERPSLDELESLITESINKQLNTDVPVGLFLSSGIDSSLIAALINAHKQDFKSDYHFFTVAFNEESKSDESADAKTFINGFNNPNFKHHKLTLDQKTLSTQLENMYDYIDEPFGDSALLLNMLISKKAKEHVDVVLSGDGADELFCGYERYFEWKNQLSTNTPLNLRQVLSKITPQLIRSKSTHLNNYADPVELYLKMLDPKAYEKRNLSQHFKDNWFLEDLEPFNKRKDLPALIDMRSYLSDAMFFKVDRSSSAYGLEIRVPYTDNHVVDYALSLSDTEKMDMQYKGKKQLKQLLKKFAPHYSFSSQKKGFNFPLNKWMQTSWKEQILALFTKTNFDILQLDYTHYSKMLHKYYQGNYSLIHELWFLINLLLWTEKFKKLRKPF
jgi:asparagine synthase (glutamine-hydrolysing)